MGLLVLAFFASLGLLRRGQFARAGRDDDKTDQASQQGDYPRLADLLNHSSCPRKMNPCPSDKFRLNGLIGVDKSIVVALEDEMITLFVNDAMDDLADGGMLIGDDVANLIGLCCAQDHQIVSKVDRLHAVAVDDDIAGRSAYLGRGKENPSHNHNTQAQ